MDRERIEAMSSQQCADSLVAEVARERAAGARRLMLIAQWALLNNGDSIPRSTDAAGHLLPGTEQARTYGGDGTPEVAEFAVHELALLLGLPETVARNELGDVLDLLFRHPLLWARVVETASCDAPGHDPALAAGMVQAWQATFVARRCRNAKLCREAAQWVDEQTAHALGRQAWTRFAETLDGKIKDADPALAERRRREREAAKRVTVSRTNDEGMKSLTVLLPAAQIILMRARIHQIALILRAHGAEETLGQLEADAAFLLTTNPLEALARLVDGAAPQPDDPSPAPDDPSQEPSEDQPPADPFPAPDPVIGAADDDALGLFDDRPVSGREGSQPPRTGPPLTSTGPDPGARARSRPRARVRGPSAPA